MPRRLSTSKSPRPPRGFLSSLSCQGTLWPWACTFFVLVCLLGSGCKKPESAPPETRKDPERPEAEAGQAALSGSGPKPAAIGIDRNGRLHAGQEDRCPVCAMKVQGHPKFACGIELRSGQTFYFCGTGCMMRSWLHPEVFLAVEKDELRRAVVQDYFTGQHVDVSSVTWVAGSDVVGPMGPALVPVLDEQDLEAFLRRHGGRITFRMAELDDLKWETITGKKVLPENP